MPIAQMPDGPGELSDTMTERSPEERGLAAVCSSPRHASALLVALLLGTAGVPQVAAQTPPVQEASTPALAPAVAEPAAAASPADAQPARVSTGLVTIESDQQRADQLTGVITATGNVRIVYPDERVVATARQAQYFSKENRVVLSGDVDIVQEGGNLIRAERVVYLVDGERLIAVPPSGQQVFSRVRIQQSPPPTPAAPAAAPATQP
jgi:lipopolysaccharide export system protein LptA